MRPKQYFILAWMFFVAAGVCAARDFEAECQERVQRLGYWVTPAENGYSKEGFFLFMGREQQSARNYRPLFLDYKTSRVLDLIPEADFDRIRDWESRGNVMELASDLKREMVAMNVGYYHFVGEGKNKKQIATSIVLVYSLPEKRIVFREDSDRYWTELSLSPDGRYLCGYTHPPSFAGERDWNESLTGYQVEAVDLKSGQKQILAPECLLYPPSPRFYWSEDSKELVFPHRASGETRQSSKATLKKWNVQDSPQNVKEFLLGGDRRYLDRVLLLPDRSLVLVTSGEMLTLDSDLRNPKTLFVPEKDYWFDLDSVQCGPAGLSFQTWTRDKSNPNAERTFKKVTLPLPGI